VNGTLDEGNIQAGVTISFYSDNNTVGGTTEAARNIISGNDNYGVWISGNNTDANTVIGNYIGTQVNGTTALANGNGVFLSTSTKTIPLGELLQEQEILFQEIQIMVLKFKIPGQTITQSVETISVLIKTELPI